VRRDSFFFLIVSRISARNGIGPYLFLVVACLPAAVHETFSFGVFFTPDAMRYKLVNVPISYVFWLFSGVILAFRIKKLYVLKASGGAIILWVLFFLFATPVNANLLPASSVNALLLHYSWGSALLMFLALIALYPAAETRFRFLTMISAIYLVMMVVTWVQEFGSRVNAPNMDFAATALVFSIVFLVSLSRYQKNEGGLHVPVFSAFGLFLTGNRGDIVLCLILMLVILFRNLTWFGRIFSVFGVVFACVLVFFVGTGGIDGSAADSWYGEDAGLDRLRALSDFNLLLADKSLLGRVESLVVGWVLLIDHPIGVGPNIDALQSGMNALGYPTFPHSTIMSTYILFGPIFLFVIFLHIRIGIHLASISSSFFYGWLYLSIHAFGFGGAEFKVMPIFWLIASFFLFKNFSTRRKLPKRTAG